MRLAETQPSGYSATACLAWHRKPLHLAALTGLAAESQSVEPAKVTSQCASTIGSWPTMVEGGGSSDRLAELTSIVVGTNPKPSAELPRRVVRFDFLVGGSTLDRKEESLFFFFFGRQKPRKNPPFQPRNDGRSRSHRLPNLTAQSSVCELQTLFSLLTASFPLGFEAPSHAVLCPAFSLQGAADARP